MKRKYYKDEQLQQRSPEWLNARMGKFTSSNIFKLFAAPTRNDIQEQATEAFKTGKYKGAGLVPSFYSEQQLDQAAKALGFKGPELKKVKKELKGEIVSSIASKVCDMVECLKETVVFSEGAKKYILQKAGEFVFPNSEQSFQSEDMQRGVENEYFGLQKYFEVSGYKELDISFVELGGDIASSPDRLFKTQQGLNGGIELKCPNQVNYSFAKNYIKTESDVFKYYPKYFYQVHHQIFVCNLDFVDLVFFHNDLTSSPYSCLHGIRIYKEPAIIAKFEKVLPEAVRLRNQETKGLVKKENYPFLNA